MPWKMLKITWSVDLREEGIVWNSVELKHVKVRQRSRNEQLRLSRNS